MKKKFSFAVLLLSAFGIALVFVRSSNGHSYSALPSWFDENIQVLSSGEDIIIGKGLTSVHECSLVYAIYVFYIDEDGFYHTIAELPYSDANLSWAMQSGYSFTLLTNKGYFTECDYSINKTCSRLDCRLL